MVVFRSVEVEVQITIDDVIAASWPALFLPCCVSLKVLAQSEEKPNILVIWGR
jgi:hypothetical protein